jgi:hypothetical protein
MPFPTSEVEIEAGGFETDLLYSAFIRMHILTHKQGSFDSIPSPFSSLGLVARVQH